MLSSSDEDYDPLWFGLDLQAHIMEEFEIGFNRLCNVIESGQHPQRANVETMKQNQYNILFDIAKRLNLYPNNRENIYARTDLHDLVDNLWDGYEPQLDDEDDSEEQRLRDAYARRNRRPWNGYEQQLDDAYARRDRYIEQRINTITENENQRFGKRDKLTLLQFYKALLLPTIKKEDLERDADTLYTGSQSIRQWYNIYLGRLRPKPHLGTLAVPAPAPEPTFRPKPIRSPKPKPKPFKVDSETRENIREEQRKFLRQNRIDVDNDAIIPYPFKSKIREYKTRFPDTPYEDIPVDPKVKSKTRKLEKPYFSPEPHSWEVDLVFNLLEQGDVYLFCININTKYLVVYKVESKRAADVLPSLIDLRNRFEVKSIKGDGERSFAAEDTKRFWSHYHIKTYFSKTKFTNHNRVVDSVIRTIRNAIGYRNISEEQLEQIVNYYNNTKHSGTGFTPIDMMEDIDKEFYYIRRCNERLIDVKKRLPKLKQGNVVLVHLELSKVAGKFEKKRKTFDRIGVFQEYLNGNVRVKISPPVQISSGLWRDDVLVPEYAVRFVAEDINSLPEKYKRTFYSDVFLPNDENETEEK